MPIVKVGKSPQQIKKTQVALNEKPSKDSAVYKKLKEAAKKGK